MKKVLRITAMLVALCSCAQLDFLNQKLTGVKKMIIECEYERAIDTSQRFTVMGSLSEKRLAYLYLAVVYQEKKMINDYNYIIERFLFSIRDRSYSKIEIIHQIDTKNREIIAMRQKKLGFSECAS